MEKKEERISNKIKCKKCGDIIKTIVESIIAIFHKVEFEDTRVIRISRWI